MIKRIISKETRRKLGNGRRGKPPWNKGKKGLQVAWNKGIPQSEEAKQKYHLAHSGKNSSNYGKPAWNRGLKNTYRHTEGWKRELSLSQMGKKLSEETKRKLFESKKGSIPWNKGKTGVYSKETLKKFRIIMEKRYFLLLLKNRERAYL